jgi:pimeloyl-ACP methyl ester carboxylesterase
MKAKLPNARSVVIEGAGHCVNLEQSEAFDRAVLEFLRARPNS